MEQNQQYDYKYFNNVKLKDHELDKLAAEGWEMVSSKRIAPSPYSRSDYVFKRKVTDGKEPTAVIIDPVKESGKKAYLWLGWLTGGIFFVVGLANIGSRLGEGVIDFLAALVLLPPAAQLIREKFHLPFSRWFRITTAAVLLIVAFAVAPADVTTSPTVSDTVTPSATTTATTEVSSPTPAPVLKATSTKTAPTVPTTNPAPTPSASSTPSETVSQRNAVKKAMDYLVYSAFSHDGLVGQLEYDKFSPSDAVYGADNSGGDWDKEAAQKAQEYMSYSAFSHDGLVAQLEYDKFTQAQAEYGANAVGL